MIFGRKRSIFEIFHSTTVMIPWLIAKGADICKRSADQYPWPAWDNVARYVADIIREPYERPQITRDPQHETSHDDSLGWVWQYDVLDMVCNDPADCVCNCSPQGCTFHTKVLVRAVPHLEESTYFGPLWGPFLDGTSLAFHPSSLKRAS